MSSSPQTEGKKILIVEDDWSLAKALQDKLERNGYMVLRAENGEEGLTLALQEKPAVILADILMPKMTGTELMDALRKDAWGATVPIIILTNLSADSMDLVHSVVEGKPAFFLIKSDWDIEDIFEKVDAVAKNSVLK